MQNVNVLAGSVIVSDEGTVWYACGNWQLKGMNNCIPCVPAYMPLDSLPEGTNLQKKIDIGKVTYAKVFGHYGLSLEQHRAYIFPKMSQIIDKTTIGRVAFLHRKYIKHISNPKEFREMFLDKLTGARPIFQRLVQSMGVSIDDIGISGSVLAIGTPSWRHEIDFSVMGAAACSIAFQRINENRNNGIFSKDTVPPYHMPFKFENKWFDPHFSDQLKEGVLDCATITVEQHLKNVKLRIVDDSNGIFFPTYYGTGNGMRLLTFRPSHRGLYRFGDTILFENLAIGTVEYANKSREKLYLVVNEEWGEKIESN